MKYERIYEQAWFPFVHHHDHASTRQHFNDSFHKSFHNSFGKCFFKKVKKIESCNRAGINTRFLHGWFFGKSVVWFRLIPVMFFCLLHAPVRLWAYPCNVLAIKKKFSTGKPQGPASHPASQPASQPTRQALGRRSCGKADVNENLTTVSSELPASRQKARKHYRSKPKP